MLTRREALRTIGIGAAVGAATGGVIHVASAAGRHPDHRLLQLGEALEEAWAREADLNVPGLVSDEEADARVNATGDIVDEITATPATTIEGVRVKLRSIVWCRDGELDVEHADGKLVAALVRDLGVSLARASGTA